jgi:uncharacterized protein (TIGR03032 family)
VLAQLGCSLVVSTYQAGQVVAVGTHDGSLTFAFHRVDRAMGIAVDPDGICVAGADQVWTFRGHPDVAEALAPLHRHDQCWLPRATAVTGPVLCHEIAWGTTAGGEPELWIVNTLFSCLAGLDRRFAFTPRWRPPFVSALAPEDRCHLNGLAMRGGRPAFVTVMAATDDPGGWRTARNDGGLVLDVASGEPVTSGLAMPHSPRWHRGELFVLNSGLGRLERVDLATGRRDGVAEVPGYARGLALVGDHAFVGLSQIRETAIFGGAPIAAFHDQLRCGVGVVRLDTGETVATLEFTDAVAEIFDVQVAPGVRCPTFGSSGDDEGHVWVLPQPR